MNDDLTDALAYGMLKASTSTFYATSASASANPFKVSVAQAIKTLRRLQARADHPPPPDLTPEQREAHYALFEP